MSPGQKPRLEPRLVIAVALLAVPLLWVVAQVLLIPAGEDCDSEVGGVAQLFVPGSGCPAEPPPQVRGR